MTDDPTDPELLRRFASDRDPESFAALAEKARGLMERDSAELSRGIVGVAYLRKNKNRNAIKTKS